MAKRGKVHKGLLKKKRAQFQAPMPDIVHSSGALSAEELTRKLQQGHIAGNKTPTKEALKRRHEAKYKNRRDGRG